MLHKFKQAFLALVITSLYLVAITTYVSDYITSKDGLNIAKDTTQYDVVNTINKAGINTIANNESFKDNLKNSAIDTIAQNLAKDIGKTKVELGELGQKLAHAGLGCGLASAKGGDCKSGALGAVAAEIAGELYANDKDVASMSDKQREQLLAETKLVGQLVAVASAELADLDIEDAYETGTNVVENNLNSELRRKFIEADMYQLVADGKLPQSAYDEVLKEIDTADKAGAEALVSYLSLMSVGQGVNLILQGGKEIVKRFGASGLKKVVDRLKGKQIRKQYKKEVSALSKESKKLLKTGKSKEEVARYLSKKRRVLGEKYKDLTPPKMLERIYKRNLEKYGDKLGPSVETLRKKGKSWDDIIESSSRPGGGDLGL